MKINFYYGCIEIKTRNHILHFRITESEGVGAGIIIWKRKPIRSEIFFLCAQPRLTSR